MICGTGTLLRVPVLLLFRKRWEIVNFKTPLQEKQRIATEDMLKRSVKIKRLLRIMHDRSSKPEPSRSEKIKIDSLFEDFRRSLTNVREATYDLRLNGERDCYTFRNGCSGNRDSSELFPHWVNRHKGNNLKFPSLNLNGACDRIFIGDDSEQWIGVEQLLSNLLPKDDDRLSLWPNYFGQSSRVDSFALRSQASILDELLFPLSGADLQGTIAVDLETTSLSPQDGEIIEIGIVEIDGKDPLKWPRFSMRFDLSSDRARALGTGAHYLHGISTSDIKGAPKISDKAVQNLLKKYLCSGRRLIVHNGPFEFKWLSQYVDGFFEANYDDFGHQRIIDTVILSRIAFQLNGGSGITSNRLQSVVEAVGLQYEGGHSALADAGMTALAAHRMLDTVSKATLLQPLSDLDYTRLLTESYGIAVPTQLHRDLIRQ